MKHAHITREIFEEERTKSSLFPELLKVLMVLLGFWAAYTVASQQSHHLNERKIEVPRARLRDLSEAIHLLRNEMNRSTTVLLDEQMGSRLESP